MDVYRAIELLARGYTVSAGGIDFRYKEGHPFLGSDGITRTFSSFIREFETSYFVLTSRFEKYLKK